MKRTLVKLMMLLILVSPSLAVAGPKEDVAAATRAWIDGMNSHNAERVVALYDAEAVLWGTRSSTLRDTPAAVRDYFKILQTVPSSYKESAQIFGMLKPQMEKKGTRLDDFDLAIAASALAHNLTLVTNNISHFKRITGLKLANWSLQPDKGVRP